MDRIIVPPVLNSTGKNFRSGMKMNFSFAPHFRSRIMTTASGPRAFFHIEPPPRGGSCCQGGSGGGLGRHGGGGTGVNGGGRSMRRTYRHESGAGQIVYAASRLLRAV